ncbi:MAG: NAD-dependent epimerase/dehydratase family protein [Candidatus Limnocylindrales bacterium]
MKTLVVTGANGFLGRHVSRVADAAGYRVVGIGHGDWTEETWRGWGLSAWHELDVTVASLLAHVANPDVVVHCAGSSSVGFSLENPAQDFDRTVGTTLEVLEYLRTCAPEASLVYPSSAAVYGRAASLPITEDAPIAPISPYGVHKSAAEQLCRSYGRTFGTRVAVVRIFSAYGTELRKQLLWDACRKVRGGEARFFGSGRETRDWIHAEDVARLLLVAAEHASGEGPTVNGSSGAEVENRAVLETLMRALGSDLSLEFSGAARSGDPERYVGDRARASAWGWAPQRSLEEGIREYAGWFAGIDT